MIFQDEGTRKHADGFIKKITNAYDALLRIRGCKKFEFKIMQIDTHISSEPNIPTRNELGTLYSRMKSGENIYEFELPSDYE